MLLIENLTESPQGASDRLVLPYDSRCKSRLRVRLESGTEAGLFLPRGTVLRGGQKLTASDGTVIEVIAAPERLMEAESGDSLLLLRAAYHLGNRHVPVDVLPGRLRFPADHVLAEMLRGLGLAVKGVEAAFEPEGGAYSHGHGHSADGEGRGPRIHEFKP